MERRALQGKQGFEDIRSYPVDGNEFFIRAFLAQPIADLLPLTTDRCAVLDVYDNLNDAATGNDSKMLARYRLNEDGTIKYSYNKSQIGEHEKNATQHSDSSHHAEWSSALSMSKEAHHLGDALEALHMALSAQVSHEGEHFGNYIEYFIKKTGFEIKPEKADACVATTS